MARPEAVATGGYFQTPLRLVPMFARLVSKPAETDDSFGFLDPCAGEGQAVLDLMRAVFGEGEPGKSWPPYNYPAEFYGCELEKLRYDEAVQKLQYRWSQRMHHGDAFHASWTGAGVSCLFLNPPYDFDREFGRFEQRFLARFTAALAPGGTLFFLVPHYALIASADWIAQHFDRVECRRFPDPEFVNFKQVVLVARRGTSDLATPQVEIVERVRAWAVDADSMPVLSEVEDPLWSLTPSMLDSWTMRTLDVRGILDVAKPWHVSTRAGTEEIPGVQPEVGPNLLRRTYPVATPPRPSHIAAGIASGAFNGAEISPDDRKSKLPRILVKGVFDTQFRTIDEKENKDGEIIGLVQVQQPHLKVTCLDLTEFKYVQLESGVRPTSSKTLDGMNIGDLLTHYGKGLLEALGAACPVLHDPRRPGDSFPIPFKVKGEGPPDPTGPRQLYHAQAEAVRACVKLLGGPKLHPAKRRGKAAVLLGEVGVGKSSVALATIRAIDAKRTLIVCPPHLLKSWRDQIAAVTPWAQVRVLESPQDVDAFADLDPSAQPAIAILSRETAKLGHALAGVRKVCPKCGAPVPPGDLGRKRAVCDAVPPLSQRARRVEAKRAVRLGTILFPAAPLDARVQAFIPVRFRESIERRYVKSPRDVRNDPRLVEILDEHVAEFLDGSDAREESSEIERLVAGINNTAVTARVALRLFEARKWENAYRLVLLAPPAARPAIVASFTEALAVGRGVKAETDWRGPEQYVDAYAAMLVKPDMDWGTAHYNVVYRLRSQIREESGKIQLHDTDVGDVKHLLDVLGMLTAAAKWRAANPCGERLYQSTPQPRRVPLATYISRRHRRLFDALVLDEGHEYGTDGSAQERAAHRLTALGLPTLLLTGSVMNGYAESLFANLWALSPGFRAEFERDQCAAFVRQYGYRKQIAENRDADGKAQPIYGAVTDRVEGLTARDAGHAPGVLPLLLLRHLLPISVTLQKADLAIDLPECAEIPERVEPEKSQEQENQALLHALLRHIRKDRFIPERAGRLFGQLAEAPSQLDRATADTGNVEDGAYEARYPESAGSELVHRVEPKSATTILPKEQWAIDKAASELAEGRNVIVLAWHVNLLPRLARLFGDRFGKGAVAVLDPAKVSTAKREEWIEREVIGKGKRILLTNPVAISLGLNPLVYFATEIFMENPGANPIAYRQTVGRVDRIGQTKPTRIYFPVYTSQAPQALHRLLMTKVTVSLATDGLDAEGALAAAGAGSDGETHSGLSIGRELYKLLDRTR